MRSLACFPIVFATLTSVAAQDLREEGRGLVTTYCGSCHAVGTVGDSPRPGAPRFRDLHLKYDVGDLEEALVEGISAHPDMPQFAFGPVQAASIIAYLRSLEETEQAPAESSSEED